MKRKKAEKLLMSVGMDRNTARFIMREKDAQTENAEQLASVLLAMIMGIKEAQAHGKYGTKGFHLRGHEVWAYGEKSRS